MKYYIYISRAKVDMLYTQLPPEFLKGISAEVTVNVGVLSGTFKGNPTGNDVSLPQRLHAVSQYINKHEDTGTVTSPGKYISGTTFFKYGIVSEYAADIVFFGGIVNGKTIALIGSSTSVIGAAERADANHSLNYYILEFLKSAIETEEDKSEQSDVFSRAVWAGLKALPPITHNLEFVAKVLYKEKDLIVGTPIYVAMLD
ncbi:MULTISPECIES: DUF7019 family protein [Cyanophyceae]|uniref:SAVMC3_10250 family protein n=1 Tax=Leptolyngbya subtilissima DQ-A4 TaxID=2933933 RepID=A0ABV0K3M3_9CYAN|nr:SAVMC3_10250 family protein [Nodosilinea sp. FACHB-141]MBD2111279.1 hypothetical protein [Nodosilinea sp. FACHB-141]